MSKSLSYHYSGTKGHIVSVASNLPSNGKKLLQQGWEEVSHPKQKVAGSHTYKEKSTGLTIRFDEAKPGAKGYAGKDHYHILNPNATGPRDMYLDKDGNPVAKNSHASHIVPKKGGSGK